MTAFLDRVFGLISGNRWTLNGVHIFIALMVPLLLVMIADRVIRRR